jgi:hypothetical protein
MQDFASIAVCSWMTDGFSLTRWVKLIKIRANEEIGRG